jgi:hypothetical protein
MVIPVKKRMDENQFRSIAFQKIGMLRKVNFPNLTLEPVSGSGAETVIERGDGISTGYTGDSGLVKRDNL